MDEDDFDVASLKRKKHKPTFIMVPRKLVITVISLFACMIIMTIVSVQWANYVDNRSNQRWCGIVLLFNNAYKTNPPPTPLGKKVAVEMLKLQNDFSCKEK